MDKAPITSQLRSVAVIERADGATVNPDDGDLTVNVGWGIVQPRAVMPGAGKYDERERGDADSVGLTAEARKLLGEQILDVYLNDRTRWSGIPAATWDFKIGGFQVLRKWLSYREHRVLGRNITTREARTFTAIARRVTALVLLSDKLDDNYIGVTESPQQEQMLVGG